MALVLLDFSTNCVLDHLETCAGVEGSGPSLLRSGHGLAFFCVIILGFGFLFFPSLLFVSLVSCYIPYGFFYDFELRVVPVYVTNGIASSFSCLILGSFDSVTSLFFPVLSF